MREETKRLLVSEEEQRDPGQHMFKQEIIYYSVNISNWGFEA